MENNNNNNNGRGIFYGVIGVATLIVAIIGATFAYFSASANSAAGAVSAQSSTMDLTFTDSITGIKTDLIPIDLLAGTGSDATTGQYADEFVSVPGITASDCKDKNGNNICSVYQFTVTNPATVNQQIYINLTSVTNTFTNLKYAIFKGTATDIGDNFDVAATVASVPSTNCRLGNGNCNAGDITNGSLVVGPTAAPTTSASTPLAALTQVLPGLGTDTENQVAEASRTVSYTIVMWIEEIGISQNTTDAGKSFAARLDITTANGESGVTGVLGA